MRCSLRRGETAAAQGFLEPEQHPRGGSCRIPSSSVLPSFANTAARTRQAWRGNGRWRHLPLQPEREVGRLAGCRSCSSRARRSVTSSISTMAKAACRPPLFRPLQREPNVSLAERAPQAPGSGPRFRRPRCGPAVPRLSAVSPRTAAQAGPLACAQQGHGRGVEVAEGAVPPGQGGGEGQEVEGGRNVAAVLLGLCPPRCRCDREKARPAIRQGMDDAAAGDRQQRHPSRGSSEMPFRPRRGSGCGTAPRYARRRAPAGRRAGPAGRTGSRRRKRRCRRGWPRRCARAQGPKARLLRERPAGHPAWGPRHQPTHHPSIPPIFTMA